LKNNRGDVVNFKVVVLSTLTLALVACGGDKTPSKAVVASTGQSAGVIKVTRDAAGEISCTGSVVDIQWDARAAVGDKEGTEVQIWIKPIEGEPTLFIEGGVVGEAKTGNWVLPGVKFVAKVKQDKKVVDEFIVPGKQC
jgi:hypothetical protein